jgi:hypothetical protein
MRKIIVILFAAMFILGCSKKEEPTDTEVSLYKSGQVSPKISVGQKIDDLKLLDQFDKSQQVKDTTRTLVFVFKKDTGHTIREYFKTKSAAFIEENKIVMVADVSKMPSLIKQFVAIPDLQESDYPILLLDDEALSLSYQNAKNVNKIMIIDLKEKVVQKVTFVATVAQLDSYFN